MVACRPDRADLSKVYLAAALAGTKLSGFRLVGEASFLRNPNDPVQSVMAAAVNMKHGAEWAAERIDHLDLTPEQYAQKLREGVSIYYNLSVKGRNKWDGLNTAKLHIIYIKFFKFSNGYNDDLFKLLT